MSHTEKTLFGLLAATLAAGCPAAPAPPAKPVAPAAAPVTVGPQATPASTTESPQPAESAADASTAEASEASQAVAETNEASTDTTDAEAQPLDLTKYYGLKAEQFDAIKQYPWPTVPRGSQTLAGVPLEIGGMFALYGEENAKRGLKYPEELRGIEVGRPFESLYICHTAFFSESDDTPLCEVRFRYDDGSTESDQILFGSDARNWYVNATDNEIGPSGKRSTLAWSGEGMANDRPQKIRMCLTTIANPHPKKMVQTIDLVSTKSRSASCILAMTVGKAGMMQPASPADKTKE